MASPHTTRPGICSTTVSSPGASSSPGEKRFRSTTRYCSVEGARWGWGVGGAVQPPPGCRRPSPHTSCLPIHPHPAAAWRRSPSPPQPHTPGCWRSLAHTRASTHLHVTLAPEPHLLDVAVLVHALWVPSSKTRLDQTHLVVVGARVEGLHIAGPLLQTGRQYLVFLSPAAGEAGSTQRAAGSAPAAG